jgi:uncharacterized protein YcbX
LIEERGLQYDRRWMLTDVNGVFMTQRQFPRMATIKVEVTGDGLRVTGKTAGEMNIPFKPDSGEQVRVTIWNSVCDAEIYDGPVNEWFSDVLGTKCQLVYMPDNTRRNVNPLFNENDDLVSFADGYPLMVLSEASLADLDKRIMDAHEGVRDPLPMNRFRPNLVVSGADAFAEDYWERIRIGDSILRGTKPSERCVITTVEQSRGEFDGKEPLKTLASYRIAKDVMPDRCKSLGLNETAVIFGQNLIPESIGETVKVGDEIEVLQ